MTMQYALKTTYFTGQAGVIHAIGEQVWDALCDNFTGSEIVRANHCFAHADFMRESGLDVYAPRTARAYLLAILANVAAQAGSSLEKRGRGIYVWVKP